MIEALILDYGGVVTHEDPADYDVIGLPHGFAAGQLWNVVHSIPEYRPSRTGKLSGEQFQHAVREHLCRIADRQAIDAVIEDLLEYYRKQDPVRPVMQPLLAALKGKVQLALLSNATRGSTRRFEQSGLLDYFDAIICSGDVGVAKPDDEAFHLAARKLAVSVEKCAFVDDVEENVDAASRLGMKAMLYHHSRHHEFVNHLRDWKLIM